MKTPQAIAAAEKKTLASVCSLNSFTYCGARGTEPLPAHPARRGVTVAGQSPSDVHHLMSCTTLARRRPTSLQHTERLPWKRAGAEPLGGRTGNLLLL
jgi:hypothetical protein